MGGLRRPTDKIAVEEILSYTPPLPRNGFDEPLSYCDKQERVSSIIWCFITPRDAIDHPDTLWAKPPRHSLLSLWSWLSDEPISDSITNHALGRLCALSADKLFCEHRHLRSILGARCSLPSRTTLFSAPPTPADSPRDCLELFTLLCTISGIQLPGSADECHSLLVNIRAKISGLPTSPSDTRYREAMAAVLWATNLADKERVPQHHTTYPTAAALETLSTLFPSDGTPGQNAWTSLILTIKRRWSSRSGTTPARTLKRPASDARDALPGAQTSSEAKRHHTPPDTSSGGSAERLVSNLVPRPVPLHKHTLVLANESLDSPGKIGQGAESGSSPTHYDVATLQAALEDARSQVMALTQEREKTAESLALAWHSSRRSEEALRAAAHDSESALGLQETQIIDLRQRLKTAESKSRDLEAQLAQNAFVTSSTQQQLHTAQMEAAAASAQVSTLTAQIRDTTQSSPAPSAAISPGLSDTKRCEPHQPEDKIQHP